MIRGQIPLRQALTAVLLLALVTGLAAAVVAEDNETGYYDDQNWTQVDNESWMQDREDATAANTTHMITRVGTFVIGGGEGGALGALITSMLAGGVVISFLGASRVGMVAGGTIGVTTLGGFAAAGWAPPWTWALVVFGVGLVLTQVVIRLLR